MVVHINTSCNQAWLLASQLLASSYGLIHQTKKQTTYEVDNKRIAPTNSSSGFCWTRLPYNKQFTGFQINKLCDMHMWMHARLPIFVASGLTARVKVTFEHSLISADLKEGHPAKEFVGTPKLLTLRLPFFDDRFSWALGRSLGKTSTVSAARGECHFQTRSVGVPLSTFAIPSKDAWANWRTPDCEAPPCPS